LPLPLAIDHAVIAVRDLGAAAANFTALGFTLTPRGVHSIGSQNHCIMFGSTYIELLAAPRPHPWLQYYREFLERGEGLAALALVTHDAESAYRALAQEGVRARAPMDLSRPVVDAIARFRIVQLETGGFSFFLCQHITPELVWRNEWQRHANGAAELTAVALPIAPPFAGMPQSIRWRSPPALFVRLVEKQVAQDKSIEAHGVRLVFH
jgi:Glyoxalase-like domain